MACLACGGEVHPANVIRYRGCCSFSCFDTHEDQQEIARLREAISRHQEAARAKYGEWVQQFDRELWAVLDMA